MKLYFHPMSGNSRRALLAAAHLEVPLEHILVDLTKGEHRDTAHVARNPNAHVPVLDDDGLLLWESRAIMQYLCDKTPGQTLYPTELRARADVNRWMFWCATHMTPANTVIVFERFVKERTGRGGPDPIELKRGEALIAKYAPVLDAHLADKKWVSQDRVTLADYSLAASFALAAPARLPSADYANIKAWLARVAELPAWKSTAPNMGPPK